MKVLYHAPTHTPLLPLADFAPKPGLLFDPPWQTVRAVDGDGLIVTRADRRHRIRLLGIDAPEQLDPDPSRRAAAREALRYLKALCRLGPVRTARHPTDPEEDRFERLLRYLFVAHPCPLAQAHLLALGLARPTPFWPCALAPDLARIPRRPASYFREAERPSHQEDPPPLELVRIA